MTIHEELARELNRGHQERSIPAWAAERTQERTYRARGGRKARTTAVTRSTRVESAREQGAIGCIA